MSDILRVNQSQTKILNNILELQGSNEKSGVSGYMLSKLKTNPIANSTFIDNIRELNKNGLVTKYTATTKTTKYKRRSKKPREKNLYRVNGLGSLAILKSTEPKKFRKTVNFKIIPLINSHFIEMKNIAKDSKTDIGKHFDKILYEVLRKSIKQIEIANFMGKNIEEKITIDYGFIIPSISYIKLYSVYSKTEEKDFKKYEKIQTKKLPKGYKSVLVRYPSAILESDTIDRLAFLFYFNLLSLRDVGNLKMLLAWVPEIKVKKTGEMASEFLEYVKLEEILNNKKIFARIALMIMKDGKLEKVMTQNLNELNENYTKPEVLNLITGLFKIK